MSRTENVGEKEVKIVRGRVDSLSLYEITDHELNILEKGSPSSIYLNFSIFLISVGLSFLIALLTVNIQSVKIFSLFSIFSVVGLTGGFFLLFLWNRMRTSVSEVIKKIKNRIADYKTESNIGETQR